jgi:transcription elongation factor Elf1
MSQISANCPYCGVKAYVSASDAERKDNAIILATCHACDCNFLYVPDGSGKYHGKQVVEKQD